MLNRLLVATTVLALAALVFVLPGRVIDAQDATGANPSAAASAAAIGVNVRDFGAVGDGKADDTAAVLAAIEAAQFKPPMHYLNVAPAVVIFPPGHYRITRTIELGKPHIGMVFRGTGAVRPNPNKYNPKYDYPRCPTQILYDGPEGQPVIGLKGTNGFEIRNIAISGNKKASVILETHTQRGSATSQYLFDSVAFADADTGVLCNPPANCSDMTFVNCKFLDLDVGFHTNSYQAVNFNFYRTDMAFCDTAFFFEKGGNANINLVTGHHIGTVLKVRNGGANCGTFVVNQSRVESYIYKGARTVMVDAEGDVSITINGASSTTLQSHLDGKTPNFILGNGAICLVNGGIVYGKTARLTGKADRRPSWIAFNNVIFENTGGDPRTAGVTHDALSGFEMRNCFYGKTMLSDYKSLPEQVVGMPVGE
jgi:hypothetical protein